MKKYFCKYCNNEYEFEKFQSFGAHITNCNMNPKRKEITQKVIEKRSKTQREKNPILYIKLNCLWCNEEFEIDVVESYYKRGRYKKCCSKNCAIKYSSNSLDRTKEKNTICNICGERTNVNINCSKENSICEKCKIDKYRNVKHKNETKKQKIVKIKNCKCCGQIKCSNPNICKTWNGGRSKVFIKFGFDITKIGNVNFYNEYDRIVELLKNEYENNSLIEIGEKYKVNFQTIQMIMINLNIDRRNNGDSGRLAYKKGRLHLQETEIYPYKSGYHTSWDGNTYWLRSSYELDYCKELDKNKIKYEIEKIRIEYYDTKLCCYRTAIPDFYLIDNNELVEIKSSWTFDEQNMKDKIKSYKDNGYKYKIILDHNEIQMQL